MISCSAATVSICTKLKLDTRWLKERWFCADAKVANSNSVEERLEAGIA
ncbi:MAG: hypothetical protein ACKERG_00955 [Candidatus Hodgkinia cicadicola]